MIKDAEEWDPEKGPIDLMAPNPNGMEFDNLYLDMNGIIHPCVHPEGREAPKTEEEMFLLIFEYIDRIFSVIRPRKLLYMAIDGPAPRAKMNQQRSRRFKAAKERAEKAAVEAELDAELRANGHEPPPAEGSGFDSNVITPGTAFMGRLAKWLQYYAQSRIHSEPAWARIKVILSDATVPGEGEHKIMEHIRAQRRSPGYEPNTRHVIHGLDADLIMLALATHEPHFTILREVVLDRKAQEKQKEAAAKGAIIGPPRLQMLQVWVLREYLHKEFGGPDEDLFGSVPGGFDLERVIDDFVFMCFFVGNDFLPHIPALEIRDGAIDMLIFAYKKLMPRFGGFLTDGGRVNLPRTEILLREVSAFEEEIFTRAQRREDGRARADAARKVANGGVAEAGAFGRLFPPTEKRQQQLHDAIAAYAGGARSGVAAPMTLPSMSGFHKASVNLYATLHGCVSTNLPDGKIEIRLSKKAAANLRSQVNAPNVNGVHAASGGTEGDNSSVADEESALDYKARVKLRMDKRAEAASAAQVDTVRYGQRDWKDRYYTTKLRMPAAEVEAKRSVTAHYVQGLCWVLMYYYQGVQDWGWYYPFHYAPCASDLVSLGDFAGGQFELGEPFSPFEQLMAVFPPSSGHALPPSYRQLMVDPYSPIIDFYPIDFADDLNGKKYSWQAVALLPFIDAPRLRAVLRPLRAHLTEEEAARDRFGDTLLFVSSKEPLGQICARAVTSGRMPADLGGGSVSYNLLGTSSESAGFCGEVRPALVLPRMAGDVLEAPPGGEAYGLPPIPGCTAVGVAFDPPPKQAHVPRLVRGQVLPQPTLTQHDQPQFSRDATTATRSLAARFASNPALTRPRSAADRMIHGALGGASGRQLGGTRPGAGGRPGSARPAGGGHTNGQHRGGY